MEKSNQNRLWILPLLFLLVLGGVVAVRNWQPATQLGRPSIDRASKSASAERIELEIDAGDGSPTRIRVPWRKGMTVQDALADAENGESIFEVKGNGSAAFLTELAGTASEGAGGRNWQFEVNGKWADRSFAVYELQPGDHVLWKFAESE